MTAQNCSTASAAADTCSVSQSQNTLPIGVFDSGLGGLTVARAIASGLPHESILYFGDTGRCPYGSRPQSEVRCFVGQVGEWLREREVKLVVVACNTATAAGLDLLQERLEVKTIGVIEPGARAAVNASKTGRIGLLATQGTCDSCSYPRAIHALDPTAQVLQCAAPHLVPLVEGVIAKAAPSACDWMSGRSILDTPQIRSVVEQDVAPLLGQGIDTLVLGCTHYPLLIDPIRRVFGSEVKVVSSAEITRDEVMELLKSEDLLAPDEAAVCHRFATTGSNVVAFASSGQFVFGHDLSSVERVSITDLENYQF